MINRITRFENLNEIGVYRDNCLNWFTNKYENIVYLIKIGQETYIGSTTDVRRRFSQYVSDLNHGKYCSKQIQCIFDEEKEFRIYALEQTENSSKLKQREQFYIDKLSPSINSSKAYSWKTISCMDFELRLLKEYGININSFCIKHGMSTLQLKNSYRIFKQFSEYANVPMWQLFASPVEVQEDNNTITCPHCGKKIKIEKGE
jgi:predicted GIY-YIG superfamily endonuclease